MLWLNAVDLLVVVVQDSQKVRPLVSQEINFLLRGGIKLIAAGLLFTIFNATDPLDHAFVQRLPTFKFRFVFAKFVGIVKKTCGIFWAPRQLSIPEVV